MRKLKSNDIDSIWIRPKSKRIIKSKASLEGMSITDYVDKIVSELEDDKNQDEENGFNKLFK